MCVKHQQYKIPKKKNKKNVGKNTKTLVGDF